MDNLNWLKWGWKRPDWHDKAHRNAITRNWSFKLKDCYDYLDREDAIRILKFEGFSAEEGGEYLEILKQQFLDQHFNKS